MKNRKAIIFQIAIYMVIAAAVVWQGKQLYTELQIRRATKTIRSTTVTVRGSISKPGRYTVPEGTSYFEILKVAGVMKTTDLSPFNLAGQVAPNQDIAVGALRSPVAIKANARLEFYFGDLSIIGASGVEKTPQEGLLIEEGDRILTEEKTQAEFSVNTYSRIDMDNFTEITFDKINIDSTGRNAVSVFQKNGICWYRITYSEKSEYFQVMTSLALLSIGEKGADFTVDVKYNEMTVNCLDGLLLVERPDKSETMNLITGQSVTIYEDGRPFSVAKIAEDDNSSGRFNQLIKTKAEMVIKHMPVNILMISPPQIFYFISLQSDNGIARIVHVPSNVSVQLFVQGFTTLQESFLYGGAVIATTLVERLLNTRISKFIVLDKDDIVRVVASTGGVKIQVDDRAASYMRIKGGMQVLNGRNLLEFLHPNLSGFEESRIRQVAVLRSIFSAIVSKNVIITSLLAEQILTNVETNISVMELLQYYQNFTSQKRWDFKDYNLPVAESRENDKIIYNPVLDKVKDIFSEQ